MFLFKFWPIYNFYFSGIAAVLFITAGSYKHYASMNSTGMAPDDMPLFGFFTNETFGHPDF